MSGSEDRKLDPAVVKVEHHQHPLNTNWCVMRSCMGPWPCLPYSLAEAWEREHEEHTALMRAYAEMERSYLAASDAHAALVDQISALAAGAIR